MFGVQICIALHCARDPSMLVSVSYMWLKQHLANLALTKSISHRNAVMETKVPDFVSTVSKTIKCDCYSKLFVG